jgi:hypothetical protein
VGKDLVLVSHGITKEAAVPVREIDVACARLAKFHADPEKHSVEE